MTGKHCNCLNPAIFRVLMFVFYDVLFPDCKLPLDMDTYLFCIARVYPRLGLDELSFVNPPFVFVVLCK